MGRSVDCLSRAKHVTFFEYPTYTRYDADLEEDAEDIEEIPEEWEEVKNGLVYGIREAVPSLQETPKPRWDGNETSIILENDWCEIGVSEYCGLMSLSIRVNDDTINATDTDGEYAVAEAACETWIEENWDAICKGIGYKLLVKKGTFSNGEGVYEYAK